MQQLIQTTKRCRVSYHAGPRINSHANQLLFLDSSTRSCAPCIGFPGEITRQSKERLVTLLRLVIVVSNLDKDNMHMLLVDVTTTPSLPSEASRSGSPELARFF